MARDPDRLLAPGRLDTRTLHPDLSSPELHKVLVAYVHLLAGRMAVVNEYHRRGAKITVTDSIVSLSIFTWGDQGTRPQHLIDSLHIPRRTLRDSLKRLEHYGVAYREEGGLYFPSQLMGEVAAVFWDRHRRDIHRLCDAMREYSRD